MGLVVTAGAARAQVAMHREVPRGEVTGLEMGIDGSLRVMPGVPVRWWVTLYEVLRHRDLRVAAGCQIRALSSSAPEAPVATATTDAMGRAALVLALGEELDAAPHLLVQATCPRGVRRTFDVDLALEPRASLGLVPDRARVPRGGSALVIGRLVDRATGGGMSGVALRVTAAQDGPLGAPRDVVTDASGLFALPVTARAVAGRLRVSVATREAEGPQASASTEIVVDAPAPLPALVVRSTTVPPVAAPGAAVELVVEVRGPDGAPVADALLTGPTRVALPAGSPPDATLPEVRTDARGIARYPWQLPRDRSGAALATHSEPLVVASVAHGERRTTASVRIARRRTYVGIAVAGGALVPGAPARVFVRAVGPDGAPLVGRDVTLASAVLGSVDGDPIARARTDAEGVAALDVAQVGAPVTDDCGGTTAAQLAVSVGGELTTVCATVDPDAPVVVTVPARVSPGAPIVASLARTSRAAQRPLIVTALRRVAAGWEPAAETIVAPDAREARFDVERPGLYWVRARVRLADGQVVRGTGALVLVAPPPGQIRLRADRDGAVVEGALADDRVLLLVAGDGSGDPVSALTADPAADAALESLSGSALEAELAVRTPLDAGASAILRGGEVVPQAMPEEPVTLGLLRDPWRARARFVRGRLGRLMLAVEELVEERIPDRLGEVGVQTPRGWTWNREMLAAAVIEGEIDDEGSASLDGQALDIDALVALDPSFTFDRVASRITRRRLWKVLRVLRQVTHARHLDLPWARRGDPSTWIASLVDEATEDGETLSTADLFDGWGRAFVLRPSARRSFLPAIEGWEVASLGPDGRGGTRDDVVDPFARVLPSSSVYAEAVGEDALVARLGGVALGRAFVASLEEALVDGGGEPYYADEVATVSPLAEAWRELPMPLTGDAPRAVAGELAAQPGALLGSARDHRWTLPAERREHRAIAVAVGPAGRPRVAEARFEAGVRVSLVVTLPEVLRVGDVIRAPVVANELAGDAAPSLAIMGAGDTLAVRLVREETEGATRRAGVEVVARAPGASVVTLDVAGTDTLRRAERVRVLPGGTLLAAHAGARIGEEPATLAVTTPPEARGLGTTLTVVAPRALDRAPIFASTTLPGLDAVVAWARSLEGDLDPALAARASRHAVAPTSEGGAIADACALVALASTGEHAADVTTLRSRVQAARAGTPGERAAVLAALAGVAPVGLGTDADPVASMLASLRLDGWRTLATERDSPAVMARVAAGLLLADPEDGPGLALYRAAREALRPDARGGRALAGDARRVGDGWMGTLALALAARQVGDDALADELAAAAMRDAHLVRRTGVEGAFWALAASVYGALGAGSAGEGAPHAVVEIAGTRREIALTDGGVALPVPSGAAVRVQSDAPVLATLEARWLRPLGEQHHAPFALRLEGVVGETRSALELVVEAGATEVAAPVVELQLPGLGVLDAIARDALVRTGAVVRVEEPDRGGVVRLHLVPLRAGTLARLPLALRWLGHGHAEGLALVGYDAPRPTETTTVAARRLDLAAPPEER
jgi:hypothetical protein